MTCTGSLNGAVQKNSHCYRCGHGYCEIHFKDVPEHMLAIADSIPNLTKGANIGNSANRMITLIKGDREASET